MISEWMGRNSGPDEDKEDIREELQDMEMLGEMLKEELGDDIKQSGELEVLTGCRRYSNIVTRMLLLDCWFTVN